MAVKEKTLRRYPRVHKALTKAGHSPIKAAEIIRDARRKTNGALRWIRLIRRL